MLKLFQLNQEIIKILYAFRKLLKTNITRNVKNEIIFTLKTLTIKRITIYFESPELTFMEFEKQIFWDTRRIGHQTVFLPHQQKASYKFIKSCLNLI